MVQFADRMDLLKGSAIRELLALANKPEIISFAGGMCRTDAGAHSRRLLKANLLPAGICVLLYGALSVRFPLSSVDRGLMTAITDHFTVGWYTAIPAAVMLLLPIFKVRTKLAMAAPGRPI